MVGWDSGVPPFLFHRVYWRRRPANVLRDSPDFANGLFLTAANLGCVLGTTVSGRFIEAWGTGYAVLRGLLFCLLAALTVWAQCYQQRMNSSLTVQAEH